MRFLEALLFLSLFSSPVLPSEIFVPDDFATIQEAIDAAAPGDTIVVRPGTYVENIDFRGKALTVTSEKGPGVTVIDGNRSGSTVTFAAGEGPDSVLEGFTVRNGSGTFVSSPFNDYCGGGIFCSGSSPLVEGNRIKDNEASYGGGFFSSGPASPMARGNFFSGNAGKVGGGLFLRGSDATILGNVVEGNTASYGGGGIACWQASAPVIANDVVRNNIAHDGGGGGVRCYGNTAPLIVNDTLVGNEAVDGSGGGIYSKDSFTVVVNTILWNDSAAKGKEIAVALHTGPSSLAIGYSDLEGGQSSVSVETGCTLDWGAGMIDADPLFADEGEGDLHLTWPSPCRNTGDTSFCSLPAEDFEGDPRSADGAVDIGGDEFFYHLYSIGSPAPGKAFFIKIAGPPGFSPVTLALGFHVADPPLPTAHGDLYLLPPLFRLWNAGAVPAPGILTFPAMMPASSQPGDAYPFQALEGSWGGARARLTNLMTLRVEP